MKYIMLDILKQFSEQLISPDLFIRKRYATFQELLERDRTCHSLLAELEDIYYSARPVDINCVRALYSHFSTNVRLMLEGLYQLAPGQYKNLIDYYKKIDFYARFALAPPKSLTEKPFILPINAFYTDDSRTGGKGLHIAQLSKTLNLPVPAGFIVSTSAFNTFLEKNDLRGKIDDQLAGTNINSLTSLRQTSETITRYIEQARIVTELEKEIVAAINSLAEQYPDKKFAVRSSAVGEDSSLSFAGQYCSLLNVRKKEILTAYRRVLASKYTPEAILYRIINGLGDEETPMAVIVLVMVEARMSGVVTTGNPSTPETSSTMVHAVSGLGDNLMAGRATPSTLEVRLFGGKTEIIRSSRWQEIAELPEGKIRQLAEWAEAIAAYYGVPQEIEWSYDIHGAIYLLQARRLHQEEDNSETAPPDTSHLSLLFRAGATASYGLCSGTVCHLPATDSLHTIPDGSILITEVTPPSLVTLLPRLAGVIASGGSVADHFASVAREFGIPVLVQAGKECLLLKEGQEITLWTEQHTVYSGTTKLADETRGTSRRTKQGPLYSTLKMVIDFCSPLSLVDATSKDFKPENCRSLHDILRFIHEKSVQAMFFQSPDGLFRKPKGASLQTDIPLQVQIIDLGGGLLEESATKKQVGIRDICCQPLLALWRGLSNPKVSWRQRSHFDWQSYDSIALAGGVATKSDAALASFCLISPEYLNVNIRFGYHFTLLDSLCGENPDENYILLRFAGGGGNSLGKDLRLIFISKVLAQLGFSCEQTGELLDGRLMRYDKQTTTKRLDQLGRLLGAVRLLDMVLTDEAMVPPMVEDFFQGRYDFSNE